MAQRERIVAELGRPETPDETADRKAASSRAYRSSQTTRNLIVALLATLAIVVVIVWGVPRGEPTPPEAIDVDAIAADVGDAYDHDVVVPDAPSSWRVNDARVDPEVPAWSIVYVPGGSSFLRVEQAFGADETWASQRLGGTAPNDTQQIAGIEWDVYEIADPAAQGNVSYALGVQAGADHLLIYGSAGPETAAEIARLVAPQVRALTKESR